MKQIQIKEYLKNTISKEESQKRFTFSDSREYREWQYEHNDFRKRSFNRRWKSSKKEREELEAIHPSRNSFKFILSQTATTSNEDFGLKKNIYINKHTHGGMLLNITPLKNPQREMLSFEKKRKPFTVTTKKYKNSRWKTCSDCNRTFYISIRDDNSRRYSEKCLCQMNLLEKSQYWKVRKARKKQYEFEQQKWWALLRPTLVKEPKIIEETIVPGTTISLEDQWLKEKERIYADSNLFMRNVLLESTFKFMFKRDPKLEDLRR